MKFGRSDVSEGFVKRELGKKKSGRDRVELRFHKKAPGCCAGGYAKATIYPAERSRNRADLPREAPPNRGSYTQGRILASPPIGRHVARHCFIHACCTFLVYLVQVAPAGFEPTRLYGTRSRSSFLRRLYKWQRDRR